MRKLAENPIARHYIGMPCMFGEAVCRIVGESEKGSWGNINGFKVPSIPLLATPHGTVIELGRFYIDKITKEGLKKLEEYENAAVSEGRDVYLGLIYLENGKYVTQEKE